MSRVWPGRPPLCTRVPPSRLPAVCSLPTHSPVSSGRREGGQRLLSSHQEALGIEASSPPQSLPLRVPDAAAAAAAGEARPLLKGRGPTSSSSSLQPSSLPPMPLPFFPAAQHARQGSAGSQHGGGGGGGTGGGGESPPAGSSPTKKRKAGSKLSLQEDAEDICPTCEPAGCRKGRGDAPRGRAGGGRAHTAACPAGRLPRASISEAGSTPSIDGCTCTRRQRAADGPGS